MGLKEYITNFQLANEREKKPRKTYTLPFSVKAGILLVGGAALAFGTQRVLSSDSEQMSEERICVSYYIERAPHQDPDYHYEEAVTFNELKELRSNEQVHFLNIRTLNPYKG